MPGGTFLFPGIQKVAPAQAYSLQNESSEETRSNCKEALAANTHTEYHGWWWRYTVVPWPHPGGSAIGTLIHSWLTYLLALAGCLAAQKLQGEARFWSLNEVLELCERDWNSGGFLKSLLASYVEESPHLGLFLPFIPQEGLGAYIASSCPIYQCENRRVAHFHGLFSFCVCSQCPS